MASGLLGERFGDTFFKIVAVVVTFVVALFWVLVSVKCILGAIDGSLFFEIGKLERKVKGDSRGSQRECKNGSPSGSTTKENSEV